MSISMGFDQFINSVLFPQWWKVDDRLARGTSILGFCSGAGAVLHTFAIGHIMHRVGLDKAHVGLYVLAGIHFLAVVAIFTLLRGQPVYEIMNAEKGDTKGLAFSKTKREET